MDSGRNGGFSPPSEEAANALIAKELTNLSKIERESVLHDIHGVASDLPSENASKTSQLLNEMDQALNSRECDAYKQALQQNRNYVEDESFRCKFLRAEHMDPVKAVDRMVAFFEKKLEIFGPELLGREIGLEDLTQEDLAVVQGGHLQLLAKRDTARRQIFVNMLTNEKYDKPINLLRALYYITMAASEDEETQRKGLVCILFNLGRNAQQGMNDPATLLAATSLRNVLPLRYASVHYCYNGNPQFLDYIHTEICAFDLHTRCRSRIHVSSVMECHYRLVSFGIPMRCLPTSILGRLLVEDHQTWLLSRKQVEEQLVVSPTPVHSFPDVIPPDSVVSLSDAQSSDTDDTNSEDGKFVTPTTSDVLFGRGKVKDHPGNVRLHQLIDCKQAQYEKAEKWEKTIIAEGIVAAIREDNGRFLKPSPGGKWLVVGTETAREKVSHAFRSRRPKAAVKHDIFSSANSSMLKRQRLNF